MKMNRLQRNFGVVNPRHPLTERIARSVQETRRDPHAWWEGRVIPHHGLQIIRDDYPIGKILRALRRLFRR